MNRIRKRSYSIFLARLVTLDCGWAYTRFGMRMAEYQGPNHVIQVFRIGVN